MEKRAVVLLSGGIDSAVSLWWTQAQGWNAMALTFNYFRRPEKEKEATEALVRRIGNCVLRQVDLPFLREVVDVEDSRPGKRALSKAPEGYIPARNMIFYSIAASEAEIWNAEHVVGGHNGSDPETFPDSDPRFFERLNRLYEFGLWSYPKKRTRIVLPLMKKSKEDVVKLGLSLGVPFELTWSCYWDGQSHCGKCPSCVERIGAFEKIGVGDPVPYLVHGSGMEGDGGREVRGHRIH